MLSNKFFSPFFLIGLCVAQLCATELTPYFEYSDQDVQKLQQLHTDATITQEELKKWDEYVKEVYKDTPGSLNQQRLLAYLYVAQNDAAALSFQAKGKYAGSLDPLSHAVVTSLLPNSTKPALFHTDTYSNTLASIVVEKVRQRIKSENERNVEFKVPEELSEDYYIGMSVAKWLPWYAIPSTAYWPPAPPPAHDPRWKEQIKEIRKAQSPMTEKKKEAVYLWAGMRDPEKCDWIAIANAYLFSHDLGLAKIIQTRYVLLVGLYDAVIVSFQSKYAYLVLRPSMQDSTLHTELPVPKHPSYPSNHSVTSAAAATILSYFFPSERSHWETLAHEGGMSRIWGGIHYPLDDQEGQKAGRAVAEDVLKGALKEEQKERAN